MGWPDKYWHVKIVYKQKAFDVISSVSNIVKYSKPADSYCTSWHVWLSKVSYSKSVFRSYIERMASHTQMLKRHTYLTPLSLSYCSSLLVLLYKFKHLFHIAFCLLAINISNYVILFINFIISFMLLNSFRLIYLSAQKKCL